MKKCSFPLVVCVILFLGTDFFANLLEARTTIEEVFARNKAWEKRNKPAPKRFLDQQEKLERRLLNGDFPDAEISLSENGSIFVPLLDVDVAIMILDTSGSMRDSITGRILDGVQKRVVVFLEAMPNIYHLTILDADGHRILKWEADTGLYAVEQESIVPAREIGLTIGNYPYETDSDWFNGLLKSRRLIDDFEASEKVEIFVFGDESSSGFWRTFREFEKYASSVPVNVVRAHERLMAVGLLSLTESWLSFERYGRYMAALTGGKFYQFVSESNRWTREALLLRRLARQYIGKSWIFEGDKETVARLNKELSKDPLIDGELLVASDSIVEPLENMAKLSMEFSDISKNRASCFLTIEYDYGSKGREDKVELVRFNGVWKIQEWKLLWSDEE